jgi:nicotinamidase/pyrazinamidase
MKILVIVDPQNDFCNPRGSLYIKDAEKVLPYINILVNSNEFDLKIVTQDWHPKGHVSFASSHDGADLFTVKNTIQNHAEESITQVMWPNHCIANEWGSDIISSEISSKANMIIRKGFTPYSECYSFLEYLSPGQDVCYPTPYWGMFEKIDAEFHIVGFATDFCCKNTAFSLRKMGHRVLFDTDGMKAVYPDEINKTYAQLEERGIILK